ncbi:hypothetical protein Cgig2_022090 [Carnegiea gigantea]|uniref:Uncharacterized protein n=1 Tax=Carnegiea gigantea TaxID=171969 RepID=A0A9Q1KS80_9CARY|nr:hypothetical protein Cgig2_022090 [Carnegiea gigantea]
MAFYAEEEDVWKCPQHPSKRRRSGICAVCLTERLAALCPDCAAVRPCVCSATRSATSSSSASSSFSINFSDVGSVGRIANLIDNEPSFRRSRSAAVFSIFRSARFSGDDDRNRKDLPPAPEGKSNKYSIMSVFRRQKSSKREEMAEVENIEELKLRRSRSVAASITAENEMRSSPAPPKGKGWYFPSPMKVFRHSKASKIVQERSPLHRGWYLLEFSSVMEQ